MRPAAPVVPAHRPGTAIGGPADRARPRARRPGWPLTALLLLYPLWWVLGLGTLIIFLLAVPMVVHLVRRRPVLVPPGFGIWLLFLIWVLVSTVMLGANPPGTLPDTASSRLLSVAFNVAGYLSATVILLYAGNLSEDEFPRRRLVRQLGLFFVVVVAGGLLGVLAPRLQFTSPMELLLPESVREVGFVRSLVHPAASQLQEVLGFTSGRPAAPFGYTNTWGNCLALLVGWFAIGWLREGGLGRRLAGVALLLVAAVPIVYSLNRGLWIGIALIAVLVAVRLAMRGRLVATAGLFVALVLAVVMVLATPLGSIVEGRLDNPQSNKIRTFTTERTLEVVAESPVIGFGSTRAALGSSNSIAIGADDRCRRCGNPTLGSNGQLWLVLIAQGVGGALLYVGFFLRSLWAYRRDSSPIGDAGFISLALMLFFMLVYNALTMPLVLAFLAIALLWRNQRETAEPPVATPAPGRPALAGTGASR
jgi:hypothetical protein